MLSFDFLSLLTPHSIMLLLQPSSLCCEFSRIPHEFYHPVGGDSLIILYTYTLLV